MAGGAGVGEAEHVQAVRAFRVRAGKCVLYRVQRSQQAGWPGKAFGRAFYANNPHALDRRVRTGRRAWRGVSAITTTFGRKDLCSAWCAP